MSTDVLTSAPIAAYNCRTMRPIRIKPENLEDIDREQLAAMGQPLKLAQAARLCRVSRRTLQRWIKEGRLAKVCGRVDAKEVQRHLDELHNVPRRGRRPGVDAFQFALKLGAEAGRQTRDKRMTEAERVDAVLHHLRKIKNDWAFLRLSAEIMGRAMSIANKADHAAASARS
jgi:predicted DNA-binding protein (UPF0251 family)